MSGRLFGMIAPIKVLINSPVIKELIKVSEKRMFVGGAYGEKYNNYFNGNVWPHFAEKEISEWMKECPDSHTGDLKQVLVMSEILDTDVSDLGTWQRLFQNYVRLFRVPNPDRTVQESIELIKQFHSNSSKTPIPENFFESSKVLLNNATVNEDNTITISRVLETDVRGTFKELANGLFSQRDGKVNFILQDPEKLSELADKEAQNLGRAYTTVPNLSITSDDFTVNPNLVALRHIRLQYGTWICLNSFSNVFPNFNVASKYKLMSVRGNIVSEGTDIATRATFIRMPSGTIGLEGLGMWLKPQASDQIRKKIYGEVHDTMKIDNENIDNILSYLKEQENELCEELKLEWGTKARDKKLPEALSPKLSYYYENYPKSFLNTRASQKRLLFEQIEKVGVSQLNIRNDLKDLKKESNGILW